MQVAGIHLSEAHAREPGKQVRVPLKPITPHSVNADFPVLLQFAFSSQQSYSCAIHILFILCMLTMIAIPSGEYFGLFPFLPDGKPPI